MTAISSITKISFAILIYLVYNCNNEKTVKWSVVMNYRQLKQDAAAAVEREPKTRELVLIYAGVLIAASLLVTALNFCLDEAMSSLGGLSNIGARSLLSTVQMPTGVPVATVAINGAANAALLAIQMLGIEDAALAAKLDEKKAKDAAAVLAKDKALQDELNG